MRPLNRLHGSSFATAYCPQTILCSDFKVAGTLRVPSASSAVREQWFRQERREQFSS